MSKADTSSPNNSSLFERAKNRADLDLQTSVKIDRHTHLDEARSYERWVKSRTISVGGVSTQGQVGVGNKLTGAERGYAKAEYDSSEMTLSQRQALAASAEANKHATTTDAVVQGMPLEEIGIDTSGRQFAEKPVDRPVENYPTLLKQGRIGDFPTPNLERLEVANVIEGNSGGSPGPQVREPNNPEMMTDVNKKIAEAYGDPSQADVSSSNSASTDSVPSVPPSQEVQMHYEKMKSEPLGNNNYV